MTETPDFTLNGISIRRPDVSSYTERIRSQEGFAFSRWGDGEWRAVFGKVRGSNCDKHKFFPEMNEQLADVLKSKPTYIMGMQMLAMKEYGKKIPKWLGWNDLEFDWVDSDVFHKAAIYGRLDEIVEAVNTRHLIVVGPAHLRKAEALKVAKFIEVPSVDAFNAMPKIIAKILTAVSESDGERALVSLSCSMPAEIILDVVYNRVGDDGHSVVDFGSLWDPLAGLNTRVYHNQLFPDNKKTRRMARMSEADATRTLELAEMKK